VLGRRLFIFVGVVLAASCGGGGDGGEESSTATEPSEVATSSTQLLTTDDTAPAQSTTVPQELSTGVGYDVVPLVRADAAFEWLEAGVSDSGELFVVYVAGGDLQLLRCSDLDCSEPPEVTVLGPATDVWTMEAAVSGDGEVATVLMQIGSELARVGICDPGGPESCFGGVELGDNEPCERPDGTPCEFSLDFPSIAYSPDGSTRVAYYAPSGALKLATCDGGGCDPELLEVIDQTPDRWWESPISLQINSEGQLTVAYAREGLRDDEMTTEALVAVCHDPSCSVPPVRQVFDGAGTIVTSHHNGEGFLAWTKTGPAFFPPEFAGLSDAERVTAATELADIEVFTCSANSCSDPQRVPVGEDWLFAAGAGELEITQARDGSTLAVFGHLSVDMPEFGLKVTHCPDATCTEGTTTVLGITDAAAGAHATVTHPNSPLRIVYIDQQGALNLIRCDNDSCAPD
jgi:hypothetical protein